MDCIICKSKMDFFLSKDFNGTPYGFMMKDFGPVDYYKCSDCGFTISKTHVEMNQDDWMTLNNDFHHFLENNDVSTNQPPYIEQAVMLNLLEKNNVIDLNKALDFAGGYGTLSKTLKKYFNLDLLVYDPYVQEESNQVHYISEEQLGKYDIVINSALFEHLFLRESFDKINDLVSDNGFMIIHTVVCENIPKDENWFYFEPPVHCAFHTNRSMSILMKQWNYSASVYCPSAKCWMLIKKDTSEIRERIELINSELQTNYLIYKNDFVDYWKGF